MRKPSFLALGLLALLAAVGCQSTTEAPTAPAAERSTPSLAAASALQFRELSAGDDHTCGVTWENLAYCWGNNGSGQLGNGTSAWTAHSTPAPAVTTVHFRSVSVSVFASCGLGTGNRAYCWGWNYVGQLGDGTTQDRLTPTQVAGGLRFRQIVLGRYHGCGIGYSDSLAYCWGLNDNGQLGDRTTSQRLTPVPVSGGRRWRQLSAGGAHTCGITMDLGLYCWGSNVDGQVGDSTEVRKRLQPVRVAAGTRRFRQVSAGYSHTCALSTAERAFCWGNGSRGALGTGKTYISRWPRAVAGGLSFTNISAGGLPGGGYTCGETTVPGVYCWGRNSQGNLGDGTTADRSVPVAVASPLSLAQLSAGAWHTCGRTAAGVGYCWGANSLGQLGDGTTSRRLRPVRIVGAM